MHVFAKQHLNLLFLLWLDDKTYSFINRSFCCLIPLIFVTFASLVLNICDKYLWKQSSTQKLISTSWKYLGKCQDLLLTIDNRFTSLHLTPKLNHITQGKYFLHKYLLKWKHANIKDITFIALNSPLNCSHCLQKLLPYWCKIDELERNVWKS